MQRLLDHGRFNASPGGERLRVDKNLASFDANAIGRDLLGKRSWRAAIGRAVLVSVPGTSDAAVDDFTFSKRAALMGANIGNSRDSSIVAEQCDALPA